MQFNVAPTRDFGNVVGVRANRPLSVLTGLLILTAVGQAETTNSRMWNFKPEFLPLLMSSVPKILKSQDPVSGRFGSGIWIAGDQQVIYPLAAAWALNDSSNVWFHDPKLLAAIMRGGDALAEAQDKQGQWVFRKKDNSTWGSHFNPWVYSRWVRAYNLIGSAMPPERRTVWQQGLELGYAGIAKHELSRVHNIPAHQAMGLYIAGKALNHPEWCAQASAFLVRVAEEQDENGFWSEHLGPVVQYNAVYVDALGTYYALSHDERVLKALERAVRFHANFTYPDGSQIETIDERTPYSRTCYFPGIGFLFNPEGRGYLRQQWHRLQERQVVEPVDTLASLLLYGEAGPVGDPLDLSRGHRFVTADGKAAVLRQGAWCASLSAYVCPVHSSRWIQDRQNLVSVFHEQTGLILGGGNTKLQPLWSTFTVGDTSRLTHRAGDEKPDFSEPAGLVHVPSKATLANNGQGLALEYGEVTSGVTLELSGQDQVRLTYAAKPAAKATSVEAHVTLLPAIGKSWRTATGKSGQLSATAFKLTAVQAGAWFEHNGWRVTLPKGSSLTWPVLPHNPYRKDGHAAPAEGRIVLTLPFSKNVTTQDIVVSLVQ